MTTEVVKSKRNGALIALWTLGVLAIAGGLIGHAALVSSARKASREQGMYADMTGGTADGPDYTMANYALWLVGLGALLLVAALVVQALRHRPIRHD